MKTHNPQTNKNADIQTLGCIASGAATALAIKKNSHPVAAIGGFAIGAAISKRHPEAGLALGVIALLFSL